MLGLGFGGSSLLKFQVEPWCLAGLLYYGKKKQGSETCKQQGGLSSEKKYLGSIFFPSPGREPTYLRNSHDMPIVEMYQDYLLHDSYG